MTQHKNPKQRSEAYERWLTDSVAKRTLLIMMYPHVGYYFDGAYYADVQDLWPLVSRLPVWPNNIVHHDSSDMLNGESYNSMQWDYWMATNPQAKQLLRNFYGLHPTGISGSATVTALLDAGCTLDLVFAFATLYCNTI